MRPGPPLCRPFFERPALEVAPELVGAYLCRRLPDGERLVGRVVEVEAYSGDGSDPSSHSHSGPTRRNRSMFGPPGRLYVYRSYGIHLCANVVCEPEGSASAVLLRALEPVGGVEHMRALRRVSADAPPRVVASGPGRLGQALGLRLEDDGMSLLRGAFRLHRAAEGERPPRLESGPRVGISKAVELPWRFYDANSQCVSRGPTPATRSRRR